MSDSVYTKNNLIKTAIDLFSTGGFKGTSIRDIAKATGMTISNIYYYFGSKDGLLMAILDYSSKHLVGALREVSQLNLKPLERFKLLIKTHLCLVKVHKKEAKIFFVDGEHLSPEGNKINKQHQIEILNIYRNELTNLQALGYTGYKNITVLAFNVLGVINWHLRWYKPEGQQSLDYLIEEITEFILHGVLNQSAPATGFPSSSQNTPDKV